MSSKGYRFAVAWVANEDDPSVVDLDVVSEQLTVALVADLFGKDTRDVAAAVVKHRRSVDRFLNERRLAKAVGL